MHAMVVVRREIDRREAAVNVTLDLLEISSEQVAECVVDTFRLEHACHPDVTGNADRAIHWRDECIGIVIDLARAVFQLPDEELVERRESLGTSSLTSSRSTSKARRTA